MTGSGGNQTQPAFTPEQEARIRELIAEQLGEPILVVASRGRGPEELACDVAKVMRRALNDPDRIEDLRDGAGNGPFLKGALEALADATSLNGSREGSGRE